jgi:hypothetical protein
MWWRTQHPEMLKQAMTIGAALTWFSAATVMVVKSRMKLIEATLHLHLLALPLPLLAFLVR